MQRLSDLFRGRLSDERGATAVVFALLLVPILGFAAIAVDVGSLYAERSRLQVAADAAAIAVAQDCSRGNCGDMLATARTLVAANDGDASAVQPVLNSVPLSVTASGRTPVKHWFAPVLGFDSTAVTASATVGWGAPSRGTAVLPLTFSYCSFTRQTGGLATTTAQVVKFSQDDTSPCPGAGGNQVPGGFAFVVPDANSCQATSSLAQLLNSSTGVSLPGGCTQADFDRWLNQTVLLPLFDKAGGTGSNAWYRVYGYAAFRLTGYAFNGSTRSAKVVCGPGTNPSVRCITGYFTRYVDLRDAWTYSPDAPSLGASILRLIR
jgi:Flp pilus assembly protein TadG